MAAPRKRKKKQPPKTNSGDAKNHWDIIRKNAFWVIFVFIALGVGIWWIIHDTRQSHRTAAPARAISTAVAEPPAPTIPASPPTTASAPTPVTPLPANTEPLVIIRPPPILETQPAAPDPNTYPRQVTTLVEAQIEMARRCFSCGPIDGKSGSQTAAALRAFQGSESIPQTGRLDDATRSRLIMSMAPLGTRVVTAADLARLQPLSPTWLGKSQQDILDYQTILELVAEETHAHHNYIIQLNPGIDWNNITAGTVLNVPAINRVSPRGKAARIDIFLEAHVLQARDENNRLLAHFPVSIARNKEKRPVGELHVSTIAPNPNYTFNPAVFPESAEAQEIGRKLIIAPGPNNPVGVAWIGLDLSGYGIHGTPDPEKVGRTESHGCFRLANWDAKTLIDLVWVGVPVVVAP
jgi:lipoprotein-anchoring transpeptidase ErfK/SrfK